MSLQVWLPLNGDLHNQGLSGLTATNNGATVNNSGKIGKCYQVDGSHYITIPSKPWMSMKPAYNFSLFMWVKGAVASWLIAASGWELQLRPTFIKISLSGNGQYPAQYSATFDTDTWYHLGFTWNGSTGALKLYLNGEEKASSTVPSSADFSVTSSLKLAYSGPYYINDFRIYDHALSPKEVEEIAKGLVLHYKLDQNLNILNNCYSYPTFNTSTGTGGWDHWGGSGHQGSRGQNTNKTYIFRKYNTYSHWVANGNSATNNYLCYQSPSFSGGIRSVQAIIKEENSLPITNAIVYPAWNARNGGVPNSSWTSIQSLGDGFYLCKCEGISQDGSNNLIGFYVAAGYKIYISEAYCENDREMCSDIFNQDNLTTIYDSSGYSNNGTIVGSLTAAAGSPRYDIATVFDGNDYISATNELTTDNSTIALWCYIPTLRTYHILDCRNSSETGKQPIYTYADGHIQTGGSAQYVSTSTGLLEANKWIHLVLVQLGNSLLVYKNGSLFQTLSCTNSPLMHIRIGARLNGNNKYNGKISDFRIYATALTAAQVKELYTTSMSIDSSGNVHARELKEL